MAIPLSRRLPRLSLPPSPYYRVFVPFRSVPSVLVTCVPPLRAVHFHVVLTFLSTRSHLFIHSKIRPKITHFLPHFHPPTLLLPPNITTTATNTNLTPHIRLPRDPISLYPLKRTSHYIHLPPKINQTGPINLLNDSTPFCCPQEVCQCTWPNSADTCQIPRRSSSLTLVNLVWAGKGHVASGSS